MGVSIVDQVQEFGAVTGKETGAETGDGQEVVGRGGGGVGNGKEDSLVEDVVGRDVFPAGFFPAPGQEGRLKFRMQALVLVAGIPAGTFQESDGIVGVRTTVLEGLDQVQIQGLVTVWLDLLPDIGREFKFGGDADAGVVGHHYC